MEHAVSNPRRRGPSTDWSSWVISILLHGLLFASIWYFGHPKAVELMPAAGAGKPGIEAGRAGSESPGPAAAQKNTVKARLAEARKWVYKNSQELAAHVKKQREEIEFVDKVLLHSAWTEASFPKITERAAEILSLDLENVKLVRSTADTGEREVNSVYIRLYTNTERVFFDVMFLVNVVGDGTLHSKFITDNLIILIRERGLKDTTSLIIPTNYTREFYLERFTPAHVIERTTIRQSDLW